MRIRRLGLWSNRHFIHVARNTSAVITSIPAIAARGRPHEARDCVECNLISRMAIVPSATFSAAAGREAPA